MGIKIQSRAILLNQLATICSFGCSRFFEGAFLFSFKAIVIHIFNCMCVKDHVRLCETNEDVEGAGRPGAHCGLGVLII